MWRRIVAMVVLGLLALPAMAEEPAPPDVDALLTKLDDLYWSKSSIARIEIVVVTPRSTRTMRVKAWTSGEDKALIVVESPSRDAGTATLRVGDNLWMYLPRVAKTMRIPPSMMLGSWMGTDFTNDDIVNESKLRQDFIAKIERRSTSPPGWWLTLTAKPGIVVNDDHASRSARLGSTAGARGGRCVYECAHEQGLHSWTRRV